MLKRVGIDFTNKNSKINFQYHCEYCKHTISFYAFEPEKKLCSWCGRFNYKSESVRFKDKLIKKMKEAKHDFE